MHEWALLDEHGVTCIITSRRTREQLQEYYPRYRVVPVSQVPEEVLERYEFWTKRP